MPYDETGNEFVDLIAPSSPAVPVNLNRPVDVGAAVDRLAQASPEQRRQFLAQARSRMGAEKYAAAISGMLKVAQARQHGPTRSYPGPVAPDDPAYAALLRQSGVYHRTQQFPNDPRR